MIKYICLPSGGFNILKYLGILQSFVDNKIIDFEKVEGYYGISAGSVLSSVLCLGLSYESIVKYFIERTWHKVFNINTFQDNHIYIYCYFIILLQCSLLDIIQPFHLFFLCTNLVHLHLQVSQINHL